MNCTVSLTRIWNRCRAPSFALLRGELVRTCDSTAVAISSDYVTQKQVVVIAQIIRDETWLEGERRGFAVSPNDAVVVENVCQVVLRIGAQLRQRFQPLTRVQRMQKCWMTLCQSHVWRGVRRTRSEQQTPGISS